MKDPFSTSSEKSKETEQKGIKFSRFLSWSKTQMRRAKILKEKKSKTANLIIKLETVTFIKMN